MRYAHIDNNEVVGIYHLASAVIREDYIQSETAEIGQLYIPQTGEFINQEPEHIVAHTISNQLITADGQPLQLFAGNYYCQPGDTIQLVGNITDSEGDTVTSINVPATLKMPLVRHANGLPTTDEIYLNVTLQAGVITAVGKIERSGDWKILIERNNEALKRISQDLVALGIEPFKFAAPDITFIA